MSNKYNELLKIKPEKISATSKNIFFGLALIRNDLGDLIYLQQLHIQAYQVVNLKKKVSVEIGTYTGRNIYILRLALS